MSGANERRPGPRPEEISERWTRTSNWVLVALLAIVSLALFSMSRAHDTTPSSAKPIPLSIRAH